MEQRKFGAGVVWGVVVFLTIILVESSLKRTMPPGSRIQSAPIASNEKLPTGIVKPIGSTPSKGIIRVPASQGLSPADQAALWEKFKDKFGGDLQPTYQPDGRLAIIHGAAHATPAAKGFRSDDPQMAIARAKEVLEAASAMIGVHGELPLENPIARGNEMATQVFFQENMGGIPLAPTGTVTIQLGSEGEVKGLYADYMPDIQIGNDVEVDAAQARKAVEGTRVEGGTQIIWMMDAGSPAKAIHAYQYSADGRQVIVDAQTGKVIFKRDRRAF